MGHTHSFQISGWGCQILPWSWESRSCLIGISQEGWYRRGISSENHVWEGQNGAMSRRRAPLTFTLHRTAGISLTGGNAYSLMFGHGWANASMPRVAGELREKPKRALGRLLWSKEVHFRFAKQIPNLGYCLTVQHPFSRPEFLSRQSRPRGSRFPERELPLRKGTCPGTKGEDGVQACPGCATVNPPWRFMWDTTAMLSALTITWCFPRTGRKWIKARKSALSSRQSRVRASILSPCRSLDVRSVICFKNHWRCYSTVTHLKHFNVSIMTQVRYKALIIR